MYARELHYADRDQEADIALDQAFSFWPTHPILWSMRYSILLGSKRFVEAAAFARDPRSMPDEMPANASARLADLAEALATRTGVETIIARVRKWPFQIDGVGFGAPFLAALGDDEALFAQLNAYFFGGTINGEHVAPPENGGGRPTAVLFAPAILALRDDPRHRTLLERTGLEGYWRKARVQPDFRRR